MYVKGKVYATRLQKIQKLKSRIKNVIGEEEILKNMLETLENLCEKMTSCEKDRGRHLPMLYSNKTSDYYLSNKTNLIQIRSCVFIL